MNATVFQGFVAFLATEYKSISQIEEFLTKGGGKPALQGVASLVSGKKTTVGAGS